MALRTLTHDGVEWTVWNVVPSLEHRLGVALADERGAGWLCFQSPTEKRRITPAPAGWERWPEDELVERLRAAPVVATAPAPPAAAAPEEPGPAGEAPEADDTLRERVGETLRRARELNERVRQAMDAGGARPLPAGGPRRPADGAERRDGR